jgi:hypothetical protein
LSRFRSQGRVSGADVSMGDAVLPMRKVQKLSSPTEV